VRIDHCRDQQRDCVSKPADEDDNAEKAKLENIDDQEAKREWLYPSWAWAASAARRERADSGPGSWVVDRRERDRLPGRSAKTSG